jgi:hypothetical protein
MNPPRRMGEESRPFLRQGRRVLAVFAISFVLAGQIVWVQNLGQQAQSRCDPRLSDCNL